MSDNLSLWQAVEKTPTAHTKAITGKSYSGNSPKPHYLVWKATETFGPCGIGWGFTIVDERIEQGTGDDKLHIARVRVWYEWNGKRGEVEHIGGTPFSGTRSSGKAFVDEDAPKKSVTDALVKALSLIGFAGDIFMGRYDDSKYVAELKNEEREAAKADKQQPEPKPKTFWEFDSYALTAKDHDDFVKKFVQGCEKAPSLAAISKLQDDNRATIQNISEDRYALIGAAIDTAGERIMRAAAGGKAA